MASLTGVAKFLLSIWMVSGVFQLTSCAVMYLKTSSSTNNYVRISISSTQLSMFYECMGSYQRCILNLNLNSDYSGMYVFSVSFITQLDRNAWKYKCYYYRQRNNNRPQYSVICDYMDTDSLCDNIYCGGSLLLKIRWQDSSEYFTDQNVYVCQNKNYMCSAYMVKTTTTTERTTSLKSSSTTIFSPFTEALTEPTTETNTEPITETNTEPTTETTPDPIRDSTFKDLIDNTTQMTILSTFKKTSTLKATESINITTDYDGTTPLNSTLTLTTHNSDNTKTIIIGVVVSLCIVLVLLITFYCIRKNVTSKTIKEPIKICTKDVEYNNIAIANDVTVTREAATLKKTNDCTDNNDSYCQQTKNYNDESYSNIDPPISLNDQTKHHNQTILETQRGVYENLNSAAVPSLTKPYARLGECNKVAKNDYNCLLPEQNDGNVTNTELTVTKPYARIGEHIKVMKNDYDWFIPEQEENIKDVDNMMDPCLIHVDITNTYASITKPYARLGKHNKSVEHDYNSFVPEKECTQSDVNDPILDSSQLNYVNYTDSSEDKDNPALQCSVTEESSNPYSLAKLF